MDPDVLARGVNKLETVDMSGDCGLSGQQKTRILIQSLLTTNLKKLNMDGSRGRVEEELERKANVVIQKLVIGIGWWE